MSELSELAEEAAEADDAAWFKDNASRIVRALAAAVELEKQPGLKECHDYVETVNLGWEKVNRNYNELKRASLALVETTGPLMVSPEELLVWEMCNEC